MIDKVTDSDVKDLAQAIEETPQWLSKVQVCILMHTIYTQLPFNNVNMCLIYNKFQTACAARKLFATLKKRRPNYFKAITEEELDEIPTSLLLHLP